MSDFIGRKDTVETVNLPTILRRQVNSAGVNGWYGKAADELDRTYAALPAARERITDLECLANEAIKFLEASVDTWMDRKQNERLVAKWSKVLRNDL